MGVLLQVLPGKPALSVAAAIGSPDTISIDETIDVPARRGIGARHVTRSRTRILGTVGVAHGSPAPVATSPNSTGTAASPDDSLLDRVDAALDAELSIPLAAGANSNGKEGHWTSSQPYAQDPTLTLEIEGDNGGPPTTMRLSSNGQVQLTVSQQWKHGKTAWDLTRVEITTLAGGHLVKTIHHSGSGPIVSRFDLGLATRVRLVPSHSAQAAAMRPLMVPSGAFDFDPCAGDNFDSPTACAAEQTAYDDAYDTWLAAQAVAFAACALAPPPADIFTCAAALAGSLAAQRVRDHAKQALDKCISDYHAACGCTAETTIMPTSGVGLSSSGLFGRLRIGLPSSSPTAFDLSEACTDFEPSDPAVDTSDGSADGSDDNGTETCYFLVTFDQFGDVFDVELLYCDADT